MKLRNKLIATGAVIATTMAGTSQPSTAQIDGYYFCGNHNGTPATVFQSSGGTQTPLITWESDWFSASGFTPSQRCLIVSEKFENNRRAGKLKYWVKGETYYTRDNGTRGKLPVICASSTFGNGTKNCSQSEVLWTLKSSSDYDSAIKYIAKKNRNIGLPPLGQSDSPLLKRKDGHLIISVENLFRYTPSGDYNIRPIKKTQQPVYTKPPTGNCGFTCN